VSIDHTENVTIDTVLSQEFVPAQGFLMAGLAVFGYAAEVMQIAGTVQAQPDNKALRRKKSAPFLVEESTVGLNAVCNALVWWFVLSLNRHNLAKVFQSQHGWFATMPGKADR
jgi:hypothetical protein